MKNITDIIFNEQWDEALEAISEDINLIEEIEPSDLAWKRFQYQLAENGIEELVLPFGKLTDLLKVIEICKNNGLSGLNIPQATAFQQIEHVKKLLAQGHNIDEQDFGERTGLLVAATLNDFDLVNFFIVNGACVSFCDQNNFEALDLTTSKEIAELLTKNNGQTKAQRRETYDEYCEAREKLNTLREINLSFLEGAMTGNIKQMEDALENSSMSLITLNFANPKNGWTALHFAASNNDKSTYNFLLCKGINKNRKDFDGLTARELAMKFGHNNLLTD